MWALPGRFLTTGPPGKSFSYLTTSSKYILSGHLMQRVDSLEKTLMLGGIGGRRERGRQRMRWLDGIADSMDMGLGELQDEKEWIHTYNGYNHSAVHLKLTTL